MHTQLANLVNQVTNIHNEFLKEKKKKTQNDTNEAEKRNFVQI